MAFNVDLLPEQNLGRAGVPGFKAACYNFGGEDQFASSFNVLGSYLLPSTVCIGELQPMVRYCAHQDPDLSQIDAMLKYIIHRQSTRLSLGYTITDYGGGVDGSAIFLLGIQVQK